MARPRLLRSNHDDQLDARGVIRSRRQAHQRLQDHPHEDGFRETEQEGACAECQNRYRESEPASDAIARNPAETIADDVARVKRRDEDAEFGHRQA